jgi:hypothetical protein
MMSPFYAGFLLGATLVPCLLIVAVGVWVLMVKGGK